MGPSDVMRPLTVEELDRWATFGATWRVVEISDRRAIVDMCRCTGEVEVRRVAIHPIVLEYLRNQATSDIWRHRLMAVKEIRDG